MPKPRTWAIFALGLALSGTVLAGCGATTVTGGGGGPAAVPTSTASTSNHTASVGTATATVNGKSVTILTDSSGKTLYYYPPDTATTSACTGGCASDWPPLLSPGRAPTSSASLPGKLGVISDAHGMQVTYNGHPLYTFANDTAPGMITGEGVENFFVATTDLAVLGAASGPTPTAHSGYGY